MTKHQNEKRLSKEPISTLKTNLLGSQEGNEGFNQTRNTIAEERSQTIDKLSCKKKKTEEQAKLLTFSDQKQQWQFQPIRPTQVLALR